MAELNQHILYINSRYNNECSLNQTVQSQIDSFGDITYRTLITDINREEIESNDMLKEQYGISLDELDCKLTDKDVVKYESEISFYEENRVGANVEAFDLMCSLKNLLLMRMEMARTEGFSQCRLRKDGHDNQFS